VTNAKLRVTFFWPFYGDYWIFRLGDNYDYAVVGSPDRDSLWFLSRDPHMDETLFKKLKDEMAREGFDMKRLQRTPQR
jgi:apolipoprotein D and lipocalin family protein